METEFEPYRTRVAKILNSETTIHENAVAFFWDVPKVFKGASVMVKLHDNVKPGDLFIHCNPEQIMTTMRMDRFTHCVYNLHENELGNTCFIKGFEKRDTDPVNFYTKPPKIKRHEYHSSSTTKRNTHPIPTQNGQTDHVEPEVNDQANLQR